MDEVLHISGIENARDREILESGIDTTPVRQILESKLGGLSRTSSLSSSQSLIPRAPRELRGVNERAFEPKVISIGPYHHGKIHLKAMESHKVRYLRSLLQQGAGRLERYVAAYMSIEQQVRNCYDDVDGMKSEDFGAIMVLDGLFVVQLIRKFMDRVSREENDLKWKDRRLKEDDEKDLRRKDRRLREEDDDLFKQNLNLYFVAQDLLLLENQLPLCLLENFAVLTGLEVQTFTRQALNFFSDTEPRLRMLYREEDNEHIRNTDHLLGLVHHNWIQFPSEEDYSYLQTILFKLTQQAEEIRKHLVRREKDRHRVRQLGEGECDFISSATELSERGIRFRQGEENCLFDIRFEHGTLFIPTLIVDHHTERIIRNLIAYEQFKDDVRSIVMDYARFIDCLINYAADVALLCDFGVINNRLGSNEDVANMINRLNDYVYLSTNNFSYSHIFHKVNERCRRPWNLWKVKLRQRYFNTPWDWVLTSIAAAALLLLLSFLQTIFSVLAYFKQSAS
ncbi:hypothetical protein V6N13_014755 [Hibiscus sabdariffa]